jgi:hypothetical protein
VLVAAVAALIGGVLAALPGGRDAARPQSAHGILQAAAAVAAEQPAPAEDLRAYRYTRVLSRFVDLVQVDGERNRAIWQQTSENWTSDGFRGRTVALQGTGSWERPPTEAMRSIDGAAAIVKPYDGDFRYGDGPMARVPFAALPTDPAQLARLLEDAIRDTRWALQPSKHPRWAPGAVESEVGHSAVTLLALGNLTSAQRSALFQVLSERPGARALGDVRDATGRAGVGVALPLPAGRSRLQVIIDPKTSEILQSSEVMDPPPAEAPPLENGRRMVPWPAPVWLESRTEVYLGAGHVAAIGDRP